MRNIAVGGRSLTCLTAAATISTEKFREGVPQGLSARALDVITLPCPKAAISSRRGSETLLFDP